MRCSRAALAPGCGGKSNKLLSVQHLRGYSTCVNTAVLHFACICVNYVCKYVYIDH